MAVYDPMRLLSGSKHAGGIHFFEEDDDLFLTNTPALLDVAKFCWRFEHDLTFGRREPGDKVLVLRSTSLGAMFCNRACKKLYPELLYQSCDECTPSLVRNLPGVLCIVSHRNRPPAIPGVHVVDLGSLIGSESYYVAALTYLRTKIFLSATLVDALCFKLYRKWTPDQIANSGLALEVQRLIRLMCFHACS
jgi:hypothetical protein